MAILYTFTCDGVGCTVKSPGEEGLTRGERCITPRNWSTLSLATYGERLESFSLHFCPACAAKLSQALEGHYFNSLGRS